MNRLLLAGILLGLAPAAQADPAALVQEKCAACHALSAPGAPAGVEERAQRKAPPLYYAGNKFRREWLVAWLQKPARIRPAGVFPAAFARSTPKGDAVDPAALPAHPALAAAQAEEAATHLMTLKPLENLIQAEKYQPGSIAERLGQMNFGKFKGCDGCHQDAPGRGGVSGPELYSAWQRLQPAFISSYTANPTAWDRRSMMPGGDLNAEAVHKLANYLKVIGEKPQ